MEKPWQTFEESEIFLFFLKKGNERVSKKLSDSIYIRIRRAIKSTGYYKVSRKVGFFFSFSKKVITEF